MSAPQRNKTKVGTTIAKDRFIVFCGIENSSVKLHGRMSLNNFISSQAAAAHNNVYACYPNDTTTLLLLVSKIEEGYPF